VDQKYCPVYEEPRFGLVPTVNRHARRCVEAKYKEHKRLTSVAYKRYLKHEVRYDSAQQNKAATNRLVREGLLTVKQGKLLRAFWEAADVLDRKKAASKSADANPSDQR
jgi:hypothetical protein